MNIVRVFNYYLYPEYTTGYILMEFVDGVSISEYINSNPDRLNDIFVQVINGFRHLEENEILHRDIRPENILVSSGGVVKIIDFGFGKRVNFNEGYDNSLSLNWRYSVPTDFEQKKYDFKTEIYFVAKLFEEIIQDQQLDNFAYSSLLLEMRQENPADRSNSFFEIYRRILNDDSELIVFSNAEKAAYKKIAQSLSRVIVKIENATVYKKDIQDIERKLIECYRASMLEDYFQNPVAIIKCFIEGKYYYDNTVDIEVTSLKEFIGILKSLNSAKKRILLNNIWSRLDGIDRYDDYASDDLPF